MACDLCGSEDYTVIWDKTEREKKDILASVVIRDSAGKIQHGINVICNNCGLVYVLDKMTKQELAEFYKTGYREIYKRNQKNKLASAHHADTAISILSQKGALNFPFLDIGANDGQLVDLVKNVTGWTEVVGIEPGGSENKSVIGTNIEDYNPITKFKCVTMLNTLEHVYSPTEALTKVHSLMCDKGHLLISVPDLFNTNIKNSMDVYLSNAHLHTFSFYTLHAMLKKCGFVVSHRFTVPEELGDKLYVLAVKGKPEVPEYKEQNGNILQVFLYRADALYFASYLVKEMMK